MSCWLLKKKVKPVIYSTPIIDNGTIKFENIYTLDDMYQLNYFRPNIHKQKFALKEYEIKNLTYKDGSYYHVGIRVVPLTQPGSTFSEEEVMQTYVSFYLCTNPPELLKGLPLINNNHSVYKNNSLVLFFKQRMMGNDQASMNKPNPSIGKGNS